MTSDDIKRISLWFNAEVWHTKECDLTDIDDEGEPRPCPCGYDTVKQILDDAMHEIQAQETPPPPYVADEGAIRRNAVRAGFHIDPVTDYSILTDQHDVTNRLWAFDKLTREDQNKRMGFKP